jgi:hypothetical protein
MQESALLLQKLSLVRCPHCGIDKPNLNGTVDPFETKNHAGAKSRHWRVYVCNNCGGAVLAFANNPKDVVQRIFPDSPTIHQVIPERTREYLAQALNSKSAPAGAVMLASSAVDSMLKAKGYKTGSLYARIDQAASDHLITTDMARWAHDVRLEANDQRHADEASTLPDEADAERVCDFAMALAEILFVLPARVQRGIKQAGPKQ